MSYDTTPNISEWSQLQKMLITYMDELINTTVNKTAAQSVDDRPHNIYCQFNDRFNVSELTCVTLSMLTICT